ncbi:MAG: hypothetical protein ACFCU1_06880, partial [Sumerlaeia bacterium]
MNQRFLIGGANFPLSFVPASLGCAAAGAAGATTFCFGFFSLPFWSAVAIISFSRKYFVYRGLKLYL